MDIETLFAQKQAAANGKSFAFLAERCPHSDAYPYGIKVADPIAANDVVVLVLAGETSNDHDEAMSQYNGFLKRTENYIRGQQDFKDKNIRIVTPIIEYGDYFRPFEARDNMHTEVKTGKKTDYANYDTSVQDEFEMPAYVSDIFNELYATRMAEKNIRRPLPQALRNIRGVTTVAFCHGGYTALKLEELMQKKLSDFHFTPDEQDKILKQNLVLAYSVDCPLGISKSRFISISSAADTGCRHSNVVKEYLHFNMTVPDFGICYIPPSRGEAFYCAQYNKHGVEGNNKVVFVKKINIDGFFTSPIVVEDKQNLPIREHDFLGFEPRKDISQQALKLMTFGKNILNSSLKNSLEQKDGEFHPLPSTLSMAAKTFKQRVQFGNAAFNGYIFNKHIKKHGRDFILQNSFFANLNYITLD